MAARITKFGKTLWEHKKKTAFGLYVLYLGADFAAKWNQNNKFRTVYAERALKYGQKPQSAEDRPRRVCVLANVSAKERGCFDDFKKNVLPLFHLAGIQVDIIKSESETQLEALAAAVDTQEADAIYIVGGDGTVGRVVTGIFRNRESAALPVGVFPGGYDNVGLKRLVPSVFVNNDARPACESAMAVIEERKQDLSVFEFSLESSEGQPTYGVTDVSGGWFKYIEDKRKKLWYFGPLKRRWAYIWEMIKRSPEDLIANVTYEDACSGCQKCRATIVPPAPEWRWWYILTGVPKYKETEVRKDYSGIVNENCGVEHQLTIKGTELLINNEQNEDSSHLRLKVGGTETGRFGVIAEGMRRCSDDIVGYSKSESFYNIDIVANAVKLTFTQLPEFLGSVYVSSDKRDVQNEQTISVKTTDRKIPVYLPTEITVDVSSV
ncbi:unnamed protein product [Auanema sp. JU1783]|nr:unnamed protein product [Auanema sp. JU1783]